MTSADGTTFIISYEYADEADINELANNINADLKNEVTPPTAIQPPPPENDQQPSGNVDREFLEGFLSGRDCLIGGSGWWRYEICYGKHVIQFHVKKFLF
jgi:endoplasmic reticulum lectin 1